MHLKYRSAPIFQIKPIDSATHLALLHKSVETGAPHMVPILPTMQNFANSGTVMFTLNLNLGAGKKKLRARRQRVFVSALTDWCTIVTIASGSWQLVPPSSSWRASGAPARPSCVYSRLAGGAPVRWARPLFHRLGGF